MGSALADEDRTALTPSSNQGVTADLMLCLQDLERGEFLASGSTIERIINSDHDAEESPLVCWTILQMALAALERRNLDRALVWFKRAIAVANDFEISHCVPMLESLVHIAKACFTTFEASARLKDTVNQLECEIQALDRELHTAVRGLHQALIHTHLDSDTIAIPMQNAYLRRKQFRETLYVRLLGFFDVRKEEGETILLCANRKGQMIFKYLVSQPGQRFHKERLLATFWPDEDPEEAIGKLHIAISRLRCSLAKADLGNAIVYENDTYSLCPGLRIESDVARFDAHYRAGYRHMSSGEKERAMQEFEQALPLYRGAYLAEIVGEDWPIQERMRLEEQYLVLLSHLAKWHYQKGSFQQTIDHCQEFLHLDDLREDVYRLLMRSLYKTGRRNQALRVYRDLTILLDKELGVEPMLATQDLMTAIRNESSISTSN